MQDITGTTSVTGSGSSRPTASSREGVWGRMADFLPFDSSALLVAVAAALAAPARGAALPLDSTTSVTVQQLQFDVRRSKSASDEDQILESPSWLRSRIARLKERGFKRYGERQ